MAIENDDAALNGGEQTPAPVTPVPAEESPPTNVRGTLRAAYEDAKIKAAERDEARRTTGEKTGSEPRASAEGEDPGKPALDRTRDQQGRFVRGEGQEQAPVEKAAQEAPEAQERLEQAPGGVLRIPPGWSAAARVAYESLPPEVKEAVAKREAEVAAGFQSKDQALRSYHGLETYTPLIEASGITHAEFTKRAVEWEQSLKTNPVGTLLHVAKLANVDIVRVAQMIQQQGGQQVVLQQQAQYQPQQYQQPQQQPEDIEARIQKVLAERDAHASVDEFLADPKNIHAEAVADDMALLITNKRADTLKQAYDKACNMNPEIRALLTREAGATPSSVSETERARRRASEARSAAKATVGAPSGPRPDKKDDRPANSTVRDDVRRAYHQLREQQL